MAQEKRKFFRAKQPIDAQYRVAGDLTEGWHTVRTVNFSAGGIRFKSAHLLEKGVLLEVHIEMPGFKEPLTLQGRVVWSEQQAAGVVENGLEFLDITADQQLHLDTLVQFLKKSGG